MVTIAITNVNYNYNYNDNYDNFNDNYNDNFSNNYNVNNNDYFNENYISVTLADDIVLFIISAAVLSSVNLNAWAR